ncbi:hypothetical protein SLEP1_g7357 [Rubroshorea leprosula]|uniref:CASP-like protein n=1 Tax=Rubroshorea leprosula TaxID=152421 RepID=A0AAV5I921_9ROSI|nr:hypothetical protein SLEP1_g7357 [Rubroshorea leprosula]
MESDKSGGETTIRIQEGRSDSKGNAPVVAIATSKASQHSKGRWRKGIAIFDFILRLGAVAAALGATAVMGTTDETLPFFTQFFQFEAQYSDIEAFVFFMIANAIVSVYLVLSLPFSIVCIVRPYATAPRLLLLIFDTIMMALTLVAAGAAGSIVYLAQNGNPNANWQAICQQFDNFCQSVSGAVVGSFIAGMILMKLVIMSAIALKRS